MKAAFVLILIVYGQGRPAVGFQEFDNQSACEMARVVLDLQLGERRAACVAKGDAEPAATRFR